MRGNGPPGPAGGFGEPERPPCRRFTPAPGSSHAHSSPQTRPASLPPLPASPSPRLSPVSPPCPALPAPARPRSAPPPSLRGAPRPPLRMLGAGGPRGAERSGAGGGRRYRDTPALSPARSRRASCAPRAPSAGPLSAAAGAGGARGAAGVPPPRRRAVLWAAGGAPRLASARRLACQSGSRGGPGSRSPSPLTG